MIKTDNPPAFHVTDLRDYLAAAALTGLLASGAPKVRDVYDLAARAAYLHADAMLSVRGE